MWIGETKIRIKIEHLNLLVLLNEIKWKRDPVINIHESSISLPFIHYYFE